MYLKSLELHGFKSFPDKTVLKFNNGTTVIVGPNGSGKSNMTDAMRWVLGELSSRNIRGNKMEDVIFAGADGKKPMSFAEVSVTFDDSEKPRILNTAYDEVTVTRRYYRNGESEYFINRKRVRLKDIYETFMNTGVGREGYSIIGQGRIAEIVSKKSEDRRSVFEESAGIARFRYRKTESEKKLAETAVNMARVEDIEKELQTRLQPLEREAEKARRYLEYYAEKKKIDVSLWFYDVEKIKNNIEKVSRETAMSAHELEIARDNVQQIDEQIDRLYNQSHSNKQQSQKTHETLTETVKQKSETEARLLVFQNSAVNIESQIDSERSIIDNIQKELEKERKNAEIARKNADNISQNFSAEQSQHETLLAQHTAGVEAVEVKNREISALYAEQKKAENELTDFRIKQNVLHEALKASDDRKAKINSDLCEYAAELDELTHIHELASENADLYSKKIKKTEEEIQASSLETYKAEAEKIQEKLNRNKVEIDSRNSRITALKNMQEHFDGYYNSVRYIMQKKDTIGGVHGPVSYLIKVKPEYVIAVETALGSALQNVVTDNEDSAKNAIRALKSANMGRATFYPVATIKYAGRGKEYANLEKCAGFIGYADELVSYAEIYSNIIKSLLAKTAVFDTLENAANMARAHNWKIRAVTLDGQQINPGGSFTGGQAKRDSGVLTRNNQIDQLISERNALIVEKERLETELKQTHSEMQKALVRVEALNRQQASLTESLAAEQKNIHDAVAKRSILQNLTENIKKESAELNEKFLDGERECNELENKIHAHTDLLKRTAEKISASTDERDALVQQTDSLYAAVNESRIKCAELAKDKNAAENVYGDTVHRMETREKELQEHKSAFTELLAKKDSFNTEIENTQTVIQRYSREISELTRQQNELADVTDKIDAELSSLRNRQKELSAQKELVFIAHSKNETHLNELKNQYDKISEQLWNDYELTYSSATQYAQENNCETVDDKTKSAAVSRQSSLKTQIKSLGNVNLNSIEEYAEVKQRYSYIKEQLDDLREAKRDMEKILIDIENDMKKMFVEAFEKINLYFGEVFRELFGGGHAEVILTDPENVLTSGIEINAAPPGKSIKNLNLLSGGEQSFIAIALLFALIKVNPSPFCIFDEIEAALDEVNVARVGQYVKKYSHEMQIIMITHRRGTMEIADTLYGVAMQQSGVSKVFTLDSSEALSKISGVR